MSQQTFVLHWGLHALLKLIADYQFEDVLDIGSGDGQHKKLLEYYDKKVFSVDMAKDADYCGDFFNIDFDRQFDAVWCSHVLEHQRNVGQFLDKVYSVLKPDGVLAIVVPTHDRDMLISGHLTSWSIPLLVYNLVVAGFDCSAAAILNSYELSLIVRKKPAEHFQTELNSIHGTSAAEGFGSEQVTDNLFTHLQPHFPFQISQGCKVSGHGGINWGDAINYRMPSGKDLPAFESKNTTQHPNLLPVLSKA